MRRQKLPPEMAEEIAPKNILMIGPTGVGKTEIARRLARLAQSPFIKVEASKFTEVGYVGRDVESMVRDLVELARRDGARKSGARKCARRRTQAAEERVLDLLLPPLPPAAGVRRAGAASIREQAQRTREKLREQLREGRLDHKQVEIDVREKSFPSFEIIAGSSVEEVDINIKDMLPGLFQGRTKKRRLRVPEALEALAPGRGAEARSTWRASRAPRSSACSRRASSSSTRSTRSRAAKAATAPTSAARACSATSCRSSRARPSTRSTAW